MRNIFKRLILLYLSLFLMSSIESAVFAQTADIEMKAMLDSYQKKFSLSEVELRSLRNNSDITSFLLGRIYFNRSDYRQSALELNKMNPSRQSIIFPLVNYQKIRSFVLQNRFSEAYLLMHQLVNQNLDKRFLKIALKEFVQNSNQYTIGYDHVSPGEETRNRLMNSSDEELIAFYIEAERYKGDQTRYAGLLKQLWVIADQKNLDELISAKDRKYLNIHSVDFPIDDKIRHYRKQLRYGNADYVLKGVKQELESGSRTGKNEELRSLSLVYVEALFRKRLYTRLIGIVQQPANLKKYRLSKKDGLLFQFSAYLRKGAINSADNILGRLTKMGLQKNLVASKQLEIARYYYRRKLYQKSLEWHARINDALLKETVLEQARWERFYAQLVLREWDQAKALYSWSNQHDFKDYDTGSKFCYWGIKYDAQLKVDKAGLEGCDKKYNNTYYYYKSESLQEKIPFFTKVFQRFYSTSDQKVTWDVKLKDQEAIEYEWFRLLYHLGDRDLADAMVTTAFQMKRSADLFKSLSPVLEKFERYHLVQKIIYNHLDYNWFQSEKSRKYFYQTAYPKAFPEQIKKYSEKTGLSELLLLALIREESHYDQDARSRTGARGLMQLMPGTAKWLAKRYRIKMNLADLNQPNLNIELGSRYLKKLIDRFNGNIVYALAAYNGGPSNVKKWIKRQAKKPAYRNDMDYFIESIPFLETKNYVKRVSRSYRVYQQIYQ